jgi:flavodoxin
MRIIYIQTLSILIVATLLLVPNLCYSEEASTGNALIIFYSRTGKSMLAAQTLKTQLGADLLEIKDLEDRSGTMGYISAGYDAFFDRHTDIQPQKVDLSPYSNIIIISPIWNWKLSTPIHTFIDNNRFDGKQVIMLTTGNNDIRKYEHYDDRAPFLKRFFRDYIRGKSESVRSYVTAQGGYFIKHYHVQTLEIPDNEIITRTAKHVENIQKDFSVTAAQREQEYSQLMQLAGN